MVMGAYNIWFLQYHDFHCISKSPYLSLGWKAVPPNTTASNLRLHHLKSTMSSTANLWGTKEMASVSTILSGCFSWHWFSKSRVITKSRIAVWMMRTDSWWGEAGQNLSQNRQSNGFTSFSCRDHHSQLSTTCSWEVLRCAKDYTKARRTRDAFVPLVIA